MEVILSALYIIPMGICLLSAFLSAFDDQHDYYFDPITLLVFTFMPLANAFAALILISDFLARPSEKKKFHEDEAKIRKFISINQAIYAKKLFEKLPHPSGNLRGLQGEYLKIKNEVDQAMARMAELGEKKRRIEEEEKKQRDIKNQELRRQREEKDKEASKRSALLVQSGKMIDLLRAQSGQVLDSLSPQDFELIILEAFSRQGYKVNHTAFSGDEGVDGFLEKGSMKIAIQCKKHSGSIGQPAIRDFYGAMMHFKCEKGFFLITSDFSDPAREFVENKQIKLFDRQQTLDLLQSTSSNGYVVNGKTIKFPYPFSNKESILSTLKSQNTNDKTSSQGLSLTENLRKEAELSKKPPLQPTLKSQNANDKTAQQDLSLAGNPKKYEAEISKKPPYICYKCGKEMWSLAGVVEFWDKIYCKDCGSCS